MRLSPLDCGIQICSSLIYAIKIITHVAQSKRTNKTLIIIGTDNKKLRATRTITIRKTTFCQKFKTFISCP